MPNQWKKNRKIMIGVFALLMLTFVVVVGKSVQADRTPVAADLISDGGLPSLRTETGVFQEASRALAFKAMPDAGDHARSLNDYYARRAYPGAPPAIPHGELNGSTFGPAPCLGCHRSGGYVPQFKAFAPITPHPELTSCNQCHVEAGNVGSFRETQFVAASAPPINQQALTGAPPPIPHGLDMRNSCLSCHASPSAPKEIRTDHPERVNCRQCHAAVVENGQQSVFERFDGGAPWHP
ncbi:MAG: nitrate reductase cytochrome c-type subunit [Bryobacterales bacterium]|jgi:cytochrome c-type protein NapB|nr:nitrate reductase cytochrome c-type subunit [Bryobacterales bacterium]